MDKRPKEIDSVVVNWLHPPIEGVDPVSQAWCTVTIFTDGTVELDEARPPADQIVKRIESYKREASYRHDRKTPQW